MSKIGEPTVANSIAIKMYCKVLFKLCHNCFGLFRYTDNLRAYFLFVTYLHIFVVVDWRTSMSA